MEIKVVESLDKLLGIVKDYSLGFLFRGVPKATYELVPKIGRIKGRSKTDLYNLEREMFEMFKVHAVPFLADRPANDWEWLALSRHHGLPTRLLDWTLNPMVAAFFAVEEHFEEDGAIYLYAPKGTADLSAISSPFDADTRLVVKPPHVTRRIAAQAGMFTLHHDLDGSVQSGSFDKVLIPHYRKGDIRRDLYRCGIHRGTLFPDLDGQAAFIEWLKIKISEWPVCNSVTAG